MWIKTTNRGIFQRTTEVNEECETQDAVEQDRVFGYPHMEINCTCSQRTYQDHNLTFIT